MRCSNLQVTIMYAALRNFDLSDRGYGSLYWPAGPDTGLPKQNVVKNNKTYIASSPTIANFGN